jgi:acetylornithine deacetylase/succinyl-diaminopimelate desuccinylase-like protein
VKLISVVDEETGGKHGAQWLTEQRPDVARVDWLLNEGGGAVMPYGDRRLYGVCCAEKGTFRFSLLARGRAGHASVPALADNALLRLLPAVERLGAAGVAYEVTEEAGAFLRAIGEDPEDPEGAVAHVRGADPRLAAMVEPTLGATFAPTVITASEKINVIPSRAEVRVDCRLPPGLGSEIARRRVEELLDGRDGVEVEFFEEVVGNRSASEGPLMDAIREWVAAEDPDGEAVPWVLPAFTDSRWWRAAFPDCVAYGFFPQRHQTLYETWPLMHSADERIDVRDLGLAARFFTDLPRRLLG